MSHQIALLGAQRPTPNLPHVLDALGVTGQLVAITAGWRHDEAEIEALQQAVGPVVHLPLYRWFEGVAAEVPEIAARYSERQAQIRRFKDLYRLRVHAALATVRDLVQRLPTDPDLVAREVERASEVVRGIDAEALASVDEVRAAYPDLADRFDVPWVRDRRDNAAAALGSAGAVLVAGGHVAVLRNRMLFFGVEHAIGEALRRGAPLLAWGAGAMAMTDDIVLFYDDAPDAPDGASEAEVLDHGLGLAPGVVLFPHAEERLRLDDRARVAALAHRFGPRPCVGLEAGAWIQPTAAGWRSRGAPGSAIRLHVDGTVAPLESA